MLFDLTGKTALITGTSGGLGQAMAVGLAQAGANIVAISSSNSDRTIDAVRSNGGQIEQISADLSKEEGLDEVFAQSLGFFGQIDILINNAGIIRRTPAALHSHQDWHDVLDLNLNAVFFLMPTSRWTYARSRERKNHQHCLHAILSRRGQCSGLHSQQARRRRSNQGSR